MKDWTFHEERITNSILVKTVRIQLIRVFDIYIKRNDLTDIISCEWSSLFLVINIPSERANRHRHNETAVLLES
jgi:hypothetical protein